MEKVKNRRNKKNIHINRGYLLLALLLCIGFITGLIRTAVVAVINGEEYRSKAEEIQLMDSSITPLRGTIYDCNMNVLAQSASVWRVYVNPSKLTGKTDEIINQRKQEIASNLSAILGVSAEKVLNALSKTNLGYVKIAGQVERPQMEQVDDFRREKFRSGDEDKVGYINVIGIESDTKRYYPNSNLASAVLGFTGDEDRGRAGVEAKYNDKLTGVGGRIITAKDAKMNKLPNEYEVIHEAEQGTNCVLTLDETVQYALENELRKSMEDTNATYAYGIVMEVETGKIKGMVSLPDYDLNNPDDSSIVTETQIQNARTQYEKNLKYAPKEEQEEYALKTEEEKHASALQSAKFALWRNHTISDTYEPGSVGKCITVSACLEEGAIDENITYNCTGSILVADTMYNCWKSGGHGHETLPDLLKNSCNPFAITIAKQLGAENFYKYFKAFGFTEKTGIDLPAEASPVEGATYHKYSDFGVTELSSYSFGQTFQVSPIQMITAISAIANGGKLMTPYIVDRGLDTEGNVVFTTEPKVRRQVISEQTAKKVCEMMEGVVATGTGKNAYVAGYHVAGKTGTSEKLQNKGQYVASFVGFAPANDPKIAILIAIDEPQGDHGGGAIAAPVAGRVLEGILPYLNIEASYTEEELENLVTRCPSVVGDGVMSAKDKLDDAGYTVRVRGDGDTVVSQLPEAGNQIPKGGVVILYTDGADSTDTVTVPDFTGYSVSEVNSIAASAGLNIKISGNSISGSGMVAYNQSIEADQTVAPGTVITVYFRTTVGVDDSVE